MHRLALLALLLLAAAPERTRPETQDVKFQRFADAYFALELQKIPTTPSTPDFLRVRFFWFLLQGIHPDQLSLDNRIDCEILETRLKAVMDGWTTFGPSMVPPAWALPPRGFSKQLVALGSPNLFPAQIELAFALLKSADRVSLDWSDPNAEATRHIDSLLKEIDAFSIAVAAQDRGHAKPTLTALRDARETLKAYHARIASHQTQGRAPPKRKPTPRERYEYALHYTLLTSHTPDSLLDLAFSKFTETENLLKDCARRIDPSKTWQELIEECKREGYAAEAYHSEAGKLAMKARDFALEKDLVTIPDSARDFNVIKGQKDQITPFGHYNPSNGRIKGAFVTAPVEGLDPQVLEERLRDNNPYWVTIVALHEAVPGHHLQFEVARGLHRSRLRALADTSTYVEGWGLYCEEMMFLNGYYRDGSKQRLTALKMRLWRCARVMIDVGLQTGALSKEEAVKILVDRVTMEPSSAKLEVDHYAGRPTYFCGYLLGFMEFMSLRDLAEKELGARFDQKRFHDAILQLGPMPLVQLRRAIRHWIASQKP